ncbi:MAG: SDR family oxidoreductase [Gammaproteobacteria bacterium]|nr:SDR family oxidoreductase [Gammaproteobacteria bacterium]
MRDTDKSILITGCSSGIGLCVATGLQQRGYRVFASARKTEDVETLRNLGLQTVQLDLTDSDSIDRAVANVLEKTQGRLFGLFNNGAYGLPGAVEDISRDAMRELFETNLFGWHELTNKVIPLMRNQGAGRIIQNSSVLGLTTLPFRGAYAASKYALEGLTDTLRLELFGSGIHVSLIEPGPIHSQFRANAHRMWKRHVDAEQSFFREHYAAMVQRLEKTGPGNRFTLPPEAVLKRVVHALEHPRPKPRYYVTFPTYLLGTLRRLLPTSTMDKILLKISDGGGR